jgi:hypothetical protein
MTGSQEPATQTRFGHMRLTRLLAKCEVRRTGDSETQANRSAKPARNQRPLPEDGGAWGGWRRNVQKRMFVNQGSLSRCKKERGRSQSPHSSEEASNDRGAKEDRKVEA